MCVVVFFGGSDKMSGREVEWSLPSNAKRQVIEDMLSVVRSTVGYGLFV